MPTYSGKEVSRAGDVLIQEKIAETDPPAFDKAMQVLSYWRACHEGPLTSAVELLTKSAQKIDSKAVIAKRLKRTPSIITKLRRFSGMKLRSMQDIGGCRAILSNEKRVRKLVKELKHRKAFRTRDYISNPKPDGYRSVHLVSDFSNGKGGVTPIELQIRTSAQHAWATAVEIIDLFTGQAIKANRGSDEWRQFFLSASEQFAFIEDIPFYNQIDIVRLAAEIFVRFRDERNPKKRERIITNAENLYTLDYKLGILERFDAYAATLKAADDHFTKEPVTGYVLLEIDLQKRALSYRLYDHKAFSSAAADYLQSEKRAALSKDLVVALVSTDAVGGIKEAYPNYFADSSLFLSYVKASVEAYRHINPSIFSRTIKKFFG